MDSGSIGAKRPGDMGKNLPIRDRFDSENVENRKKVASGHIAGSNLVVADYNNDGIADGDSTGAKPTLSPPPFEPTLSGYKTTVEELEKASGTADQGAMVQIMNQRSRGEDSLREARQGSSPISNVEQTDQTIKATMANGDSFHADFSQKNMQVMKDGHQVNFSMNGNTPSATIDGTPVPYNQSEMEVLSDFFVLMELFHEMGVEQRKSSREARNAVNAGVVKNIKNQAKEQKKAAVNHLVAGVVSGTVKMASAGLSMAGAAKGMNADAAAAKAGQPPNTFQGQMISQKYSAFGNVFEGAGELGATGAKYQASQHEAEQTTLRAGEEQLKHVKQTEQDQMQVAQDLINKARETFAQIWAQMIQTLQNQARNI